jgi:CheY-like chemotaxis protein
MKKQILLADDDEGVRASLSEVLSMEGYQVVLASNGRQAVACLSRQEPDLTLLDILMPGLDGWQTLERMEHRRPFMPVIVITARPNQLRHAVGAGVDALMEKPLDFPRLLDAIAGLLAETPLERLRRLTHPNFATVALNQPILPQLL